MKSKEANKLINRMQIKLQDNGIVLDSLIEDFTQLRVYAVEEKEPAMAKIIRLTMEHLTEYETFLIPMPGDEVVDEEGEVIADEGQDENAARVESLDSMIAMMIENTNKFNNRDLREYISLLKSFDE